MRVLLFALAALTAVPATAQVARLEPVDEAVQDPSFVLFRARLLDAAQARDTAFVLSALAPDAKVSFGGEHGVEGFRMLWLSGLRPEGEDLWRTLTRAAALGSTYTARTENSPPTVTAPYVFGAWPDTVDAFEHMAVLGERVRVRAAPRLDAETLTRLTYSIVPTLYDPGLPEDWRRVRLADGRVGYVVASYLRSPIDYRLGFVKEGGRWTIRYFVAGD